MFICQSCGREFDVEERIGRRDQCPHCGTDLHACRQCDFFYPGFHNDCRENQAETVADKENSNFCDYFRPAKDRAAQSKVDSKTEAEKMWEDLFGKK